MISYSRQTAAREEGRYLGIGLSRYVEACGNAPGMYENGSVHVKPSERVVVATGTAEIEEGNGTGGSRAMAAGGSAIERSAETVVEKARRIASHRLEVADADLEFEDSEFYIAGAPERSMSFREVADVAYGGADALDPFGVDTIDMPLTAGRVWATVER